MALANEYTSMRTHSCSCCFLGAQTRGTQNGCCVSMLRKLGNICCGHKMFLKKIRNIFCVPDTKFVRSATNVARAGKRGNICDGSNVSATMCPRLPGPLGKPILHCSYMQFSVFRCLIHCLYMQFSVFRCLIRHLD